MEKWGDSVIASLGIRECPHCGEPWLSEVTDACTVGCVIMYEDRPENKVVVE